MAKYVSLVSIANDLKLSKGTIISRFDKLDIQPITINHKNYYSQSDLDMLILMKPKVVKVGHKERFLIVEYFLRNKSNSSPAIADVFFIKPQRVDKIISEFLNNDSCITVPSKLNREHYG